MSINIPGSESDSKIIQFNPTLPLIRYLKLYWKTPIGISKEEEKTVKTIKLKEIIIYYIM